jgi:hypothetical protein
LCQARQDDNGDGRVETTIGARGELSGDALSMQLWLERGELIDVDALWAVANDERWLLVQREGRPTLVNTETGAMKVLEQAGLDTSELALNYPLHRAFSFERRTATSLIVARSPGQNEFELQRHVVEGRSSTTRFKGTGKLFRLRTSYDSAFWIIESVEQDSNENGRLDLPFPIVKDKARCRGAFTNLGAWLPQGDKVVTRVKSTATGRVYKVNDFAGPLGKHGFLFRDAQGTLYLRKPDQRIMLAPADCGAQVVRADAERGLVLVACRGPQTPPVHQQGRRAWTPPRARLPLWLVGEGVNMELKLELGPLGADHWAIEPQRLFAIHAGRDRKLLDFETRKLLPLSGSDSVLATFDTRALVVRPSEVELLDAVTGTSLAKVSDVALFEEPLVQGAFVWVMPYVFDLQQGRQLGRYDTEILALSSDGRALQATTRSSESSLPVGPLYWRAPH